MATDRLGYLDGLSKGLSSTKEAAEAFGAVMKETEKAMSDLKGQVYGDEKDQKKATDKLRKAIEKQAKTLDHQTQIGDENYTQLTLLAARTKEASMLLDSFGAETDPNEWSLLNNTISSINESVKKIDIAEQAKSKYELEDNEFQKWITEPNFGLTKDSLSFMERMQNETARSVSNTMGNMNLRETLDKGIGIVSPELMVLTSWLIDGPIGKFASFLGKNAWRTFKNWKIERRIQKAQRKYYETAGKDFDANTKEGREKFYNEILKDNESSLGGMLNSFQQWSMKVPKIWMGSEWYDDKIENLQENFLGFAKTEEGFKKFTEGIREKSELDGLSKEIGFSDVGEQLSSAIKSSESNLLPMEESLNEQTKIFRDNQSELHKEIKNLTNKLVAPTEELKEANIALNKELSKSPYLGGGADKETVTTLEGIIKTLESGMQQDKNSINELKNQLHQNTADQLERKTDPELVKATEIRDKLLEEQIERQKTLNETISRTGEGSPPYLKTLVDFFTGGAFEKSQATASGGNISSPPATKLQNVGSGILDGISSFLDGLTALVDTAFNFFQSFINGIGNMIKKVADIVSKTFIQLMSGLGQGIRALFTALGSIPLPVLAIGAAALAAVAVSLMAMGLAMKLAAPFVNAVFGGIAKIISSIGKIIKVVSGAIVELMTGITENLIKLTQVPFTDYIKLAGAFIALGTGLAWFGVTSLIAVPALLALGVASIGLTQLLKVLPPDQMSLMAVGFNQLAKAVKHFGLNSLFLGPAVGLLTALSMIPFANKIVDLALQKGDVTGGASPELFKTDTMIVGSVRGAASQALMEGSDRAMQARIEKDYQAEKSGSNNNITTTAINSSENNYIGKQTAQDVSLQNSIISVVH